MRFESEPPRARRAEAREVLGRKGVAGLMRRSGAGWGFRSVRGCLAVTAYARQGGQIKSLPPNRS